MNCADIVDEASHARLRLEKMHHRLVAAGERTQIRLPVGIRQRAGIEHEIGIARYAVLEAERFEQHRHAVARPLADAAVDELAQRVHAHARGVDHQIGGVDHRLEQRALERDGIVQALALAAQRMLAARFGVTPQQLLVVRHQEQQLALNAAALELIDQRRHGGDVGVGIAGIDADGGALDRPRRRCAPYAR